MHFFSFHFQISLRMKHPVNRGYHRRVFSSPNQTQASVSSLVYTAHRSFLCLDLNPKSLVYLFLTFALFAAIFFFFLYVFIGC